MDSFTLSQNVCLMPRQTMDGKRDLQVDVSGRVLVIGGFVRELF